LIIFIFFIALSFFLKILKQGAKVSKAVTEGIEAGAQIAKLKAMQETEQAVSG